MGVVDTSAYKKIFRTPAVYPFVTGIFLIEVFFYMVSIGTITMLTLVDYSFLQAGSVASVFAITNFIASPQISRLMDAHGQRRIATVAGVISLGGLILLLATVQFGLPFWLCYLAAVVMGIIPNAPAISRTRWTYLAQSGKMGPDTPDLKSLFSFQGVLEDIAFMAGPPIAIALDAAVSPVTGMTLGGVCLAVGIAVLFSARESEPTPGWHQPNEEGEVETQPDKRPAIIAFPVVLALASLMFGVQSLYAVYDTTVVSFAESVGQTHYASMAVTAACIVSATTGLVFGMIKLPGRLSSQIVGTSLFLGLLYATLGFTRDPIYMVVMYGVTAVSFAPMVITLNTVCERCVPNSRLTESLSWLTSGGAIGQAISPTLAGFIIDVWGPAVSFGFGAVISLLIPVGATLMRPTLKRCLGE